MSGTLRLLAPAAVLVPRCEPEPVLVPVASLPSSGGGTMDLGLASTTYETPSSEAYEGGRADAAEPGLESDSPEPELESGPPFALPL